MSLIQDHRLATARLAQAREDMRLDPSPQDAHDAAILAKEMEREIERIEAMLEDDHVILAQIDAALIRLRNLAHATANRTLAIRHLEDAESRIRRDMGHESVMGHES